MANKTPKTVAKATLPTADDLQKQLVEARANLAGSRRSFMQGELVNPKVMGAQRKSIARILTEINKPDKESK